MNMQTDHMLDPATEDYVGKSEQKLREFGKALFLCRLPVPVRVGSSLATVQEQNHLPELVQDEAFDHYRNHSYVIRGGHQLLQEHVRPHGWPLSTDCNISHCVGTSTIGSTSSASLSRR